MTKEAILEAISTGNLSAGDLRDINDVAITKLNEMSRMANLMGKFKLSVGMTVKVDHPSHKSELFTVKKINITKAVITDAKGRNLVCPMSMIITELENC